MPTAQLHAIAPQLDLSALRRLLGAAACAALVRDSWDGPQLRLTLPAGPDAARSAELLLSQGEFTATITSAEATPAPLTRSAPLPPRATPQDAVRAWHRAIGDRSPDIVLDPAGPPTLPAGWLLRSWSNPLAGRIQCTVRPPRPGTPGHHLHLESPDAATAQELADLLATWTNALTREQT